MREHTPGPWILDCTHISAYVVATTGFRVTSLPIGCSYWNRKDEWFQTVDGANARLIAAAPELLEALRPFADPDNAPLIMSDAHSLALIEKARAAIAKATRASDRPVA